MQERLAYLILTDAETNLWLSWSAYHIYKSLAKILYSPIILSYPNNNNISSDYQKTNLFIAI